VVGPAGFSNTHHSDALPGVGVAHLRKSDDHQTGGVEVKEKNDLVDDALNATRASIRRRWSLLLRRTLSQAHRPQGHPRTRPHRSASWKKSRSSLRPPLPRRRWRNSRRRFGLRLGRVHRRDLRNAVPGCQKTKTNKFNTRARRRHLCVLKPPPSALTANNLAIANATKPKH
jgi:hypothetical protein